LSRGQNADSKLSQNKTRGPLKLLLLKERIDVSALPDGDCHRMNVETGMGETIGGQCSVLPQDPVQMGSS